jgi:hypothetical protein
VQPSSNTSGQQQATRSLRPVRAATAAEAAALRSPAEPVAAAVATIGPLQGDPTAVARNTGVADGPWSSIDATLVSQAIDNEPSRSKTRRTKRFAEHGEQNSAMMMPVNVYACSN